MPKLLQKIVALFMVLAPFHAFAAEKEQKLGGDQILEILNDAFVTGKDWNQRFFSKSSKGAAPAGTTYEQGGRPSFGFWEVRGDQYCSQWPPQDAWACYDVATWIKDDKTWIVWISPNGDRFEGKVLK